MGLRPDDQRFFSPQIETMPRPEIDAQAAEKLLGTVLPWAAEHSALIGDRWADAGVELDAVRTLDDFRAAIPFMDKDTLRAYRDQHDDPYGGLLCLDPQSEIFSAVFSTSGTTGDPTLVPSTGGGPSMLVREFWELGARPGDHFTELLFTFRGPFIHDTIRGIGAIPIFLQHDPGSIPPLLAVSREFRPTGLYNLSGLLISAIEQQADALGIDPAQALASYQGVIVAGEPIGPRARALAEGWGLELFLQTSVGDVGAATECRAHDGCHIWEDTAFIEVLEPDGDQPVGDGERGELVATTLVNLLAPLVRYRSEDLVRLTREPCICGRTHARVWPLGRKGDEVVVEGQSILPGDLWAAIEGVSETRAGLFQIVRTGREMESLRLRVGFRDDAPGLAGRVADAVEAAVAVRPEVELVPDEVLLRQGPPHKIPRVTKG